MQCGFVSLSSILSQWSTFLVLCQYHDVFVTMVLFCSLRSGAVIPSAFLLRIALAMSHFIQCLELPQQEAVTIFRLQIWKLRLRGINCSVISTQTNGRLTEAQAQVFFRSQKLEEA